ELKASDIVTIDEAGKVQDSQWNVTPAIGLHLQIHSLRPEINVVVHNHPKWSGRWANLQESPPVYDQAGAYCGVALPVYNEYAGTFENESTSLSAAEALGDSKWALLANHGALVVAENLRQAHLRVATLEWRSKRAWEVRMAGGAEPLADEVVENISLPDKNGFPFLWEAMARRELDRDSSILD
ncbi:MAG: class II aldolase/adducin family protein, partial [Gammaproteobacteria bacterium]|nr:class II aldolase/adducin family protein [Gammaproteobacteria bacterium]